MKNAVLSNFNDSAELTEEFEGKYGLFTDLANGLARSCGIGEGMTLWDVGCGTGISTEALAGIVGTDGKVLGIDFSSEMLEIAITRRRSKGNVSYVHQDADHLELVNGPRPDAILYNASIFLMPTPLRTISSAFDILPKGGVIGMNYLVGTTDASGNIDLCISAQIEGLGCAPYGRSIIDPSELSVLLEGTGFSLVSTGLDEIGMPRAEVQSFYSIPAQSAGLWPKTGYKERIAKLNELLDHFEGMAGGSYVQRWGWCAAVK